MNDYVITTTTTSGNPEDLIIAIALFAVAAIIGAFLGGWALGRRQK